MCVYVVSQKRKELITKSLKKGAPPFYSRAAEDYQRLNWSEVNEVGDVVEAILDEWEEMVNG